MTAYERIKIVRNLMLMNKRQKVLSDLSRRILCTKIQYYLTQTISSLQGYKNQTKVLVVKVYFFPSAVVKYVQ